MGGGALESLSSYALSQISGVCLKGYMEGNSSPPRGGGGGGVARGGEGSGYFPSGWSWTPPR